MKRNFITVSLLSLFALGSVSLQAQDNVITKKVNNSQQPTLIVFKEGTETYQKANGAKFLAKHLALNPKAEYRLIQSESDKHGFTHDKYQLYYDGVKVEGSTYSIHAKNGAISSMSGNYAKIEQLSITPTLNENTAYQIAFHKANATLLAEGKEAVNPNKNSTGELVILNINDVNYLAYKFDIYGYSKGITRKFYYVDAHTGSILREDSRIKHSTDMNYGTREKKIIKLDQHPASTVETNMAAATAETLYSGTRNFETTVAENGFILKDITRGNGITTKNNKDNTYLDFSQAVEFTDDDNNWTIAEHEEAKFYIAHDVHWAATEIYDYWKDVHNRNSYDNNGAEIKSYVFVTDQMTSSGWDNAAWTGSEMVYRSGTQLKPLVSFDVAAHEIGHAVTEHTSNLVYERESGALNEGFSDIWGAVIEQKYAPDKEEWLIGEEIAEGTPYAPALRSMKEPKLINQPDTYRGEKWVPATVEEGCASPNGFGNDYCGVHTNSGVLNHWFYILTEGKTGTNDNGDSYSVNGIGMDKAAEIAWRTQSVYLTSTSNYHETRDYAIQAAIDIYGFKSAEHEATTNAFYAVGVGDIYDDVAPSDPINLAASDIQRKSVKLDWTASTDNYPNPVQYEIYFNDNLADTSDTNSKTVFDLTPDTEYTVYVIAKDKAGNQSNKSNEITVKTSNSEQTDFEAPTTPLNLTLDGIVTAKAKFKWNPSTDNIAVAGYNIYKDGEFSERVSSETLNSEVTNLVINEEVKIEVTAVDAEGNESSNVVQNTVFLHIKYLY